MRRAEVIERLRKHRAQLAGLGVKHAYLFGSFAQDDPNPDSDIDIMVDLDEGPDGRKPLFSAFELGGVQTALAEIFGRRVDVVVRQDALRSSAKLRSVAESGLVDAF